MTSEGIERMIKCLALVGLVSFSGGFILLIIRVLQSYSVSWEVHAVVVGIFFLLLALALAKLLSRDW
jgi:uncharacterized membrane protein (DUF373 family)